MAKYGAVTAPAATSLAKRLFGFEIMVGPYAVANMRVAQALVDAGGKLPQEGVGLMLGDTLESPYDGTLAHVGSFYARLANEHERVRKVKRSQKVLVCIGNPPYDRQQIDPDDALQKRKGGWVRHQPRNPEMLQSKPLLDDFLEPARQAGKGGHLKNIYNDYAYFWRWAMWKVLEQNDGPGVVCFITASSYLRGPGFVGMRQLMRQHFDELWILDLQGDNLGARKTENIFNIQTPVCIALGVRRAGGDKKTAAKVWYKVVTGSRAEKLTFLDQLQSRNELDWQLCMDGWQDPMLPQGKSDFFSWPYLTDLFPWQQSGVQWKRTWPIAPSVHSLNKRWRKLLASKDRAALFRETDAWRVSRTYAPLPGQAPAEAIAKLPADEVPPPAVRYGFRSFDRHFALADSRLGDRLRPSLWQAHSPKQVYLTSMLTGVLGIGPAGLASSAVPDLHHFRGSFGGKDVIPLWRDAQAQVPNVTEGVLQLWSQACGGNLTPSDLLAYCYAVLANPGYVERFSEELTVPGPTVPLSRQPDLVAQGVALGSDLLRWHTYGERYRSMGDGFVLHGKARWTVGVPQTEDDYPKQVQYDAATQTLHVGAGQVAPVAPEVWSFSVSGLHVVKSWIGYRLAEGAGKSSSELDEIREVIWPQQYAQELIELLWVLEHTVAQRAALDTWLEQVLAGPLMMAAELPKPTEAERASPKVESGVQGSLL